MDTTDTPIKAPEAPQDSRQLHAEIAGRIAILLVGHGDHPLIAMAANVAGLMTATALVIDNADNDGVDPRVGMRALPFVSRVTIEAALLLLASSARSGGMSGDDVLRQIPEVIEGLFEN